MEFDTGMPGYDVSGLLERLRANLMQQPRQPGISGLQQFADIGLVSPQPDISEIGRYPEILRNIRRGIPEGQRMRDWQDPWKQQREILEIQEKLKRDLGPAPKRPAWPEWIPPSYG
jgi:hypothetical protein